MICERSHDYGSFLDSYVLSFRVRVLGYVEDWDSATDTFLESGGVFLELAHMISAPHINVVVSFYRCLKLHFYMLMLVGIPSGEAYLLAEGGGLSRGGVCLRNNSEGKGSSVNVGPRYTNEVRDEFR